MLSFPLQRAATGEELPDSEILFLRGVAGVYGKAEPLQEAALLLVVSAGYLDSDFVMTALH